MVCAVWEPWWLRPLDEHHAQWKPPLVVELDREPVVRAEANFQCAAVVKPPSLSSLGFSGTPSSSVIVNAVEVLYAYTYTMRLYNGEWCDAAGDAAAVCVSLSTVLNSDARFDTIARAVSDVLIGAIRSPGARMSTTASTHRLYCVALVTDTAACMSSSHYLCDALWDCARLLAAAEVEAVSVERTASKKALRALKLAARKAAFFAAWSATVDSSSLAVARGEVLLAWEAEKEKS